MQRSDDLLQATSDLKKKQKRWKHTINPPPCLAAGRYSGTPSATLMGLEDMLVLPLRPASVAVFGLM